MDGKPHNSFCLFVCLFVCLLFSCAVHAAVIAINEAIDHQDPQGTLQTLNNPSAHLTNTTQDNAEEYQSVLYQAKTSKAAMAMAKVNFFVSKVCQGCRLNWIVSSISFMFS